MANFECPVVRLNIRPHPDADALEVAQVGAFQCVVGKGLYDDGDLAVYIPEGALVPADVLARLDLTDRLAGKDKNRVKAIKLRGVLSQGITYPVDLSLASDNPDVGVLHLPVPSDPNQIPEAEIVTLGQDVSEVLGVTKWIPPIPSHMAGEVYFTGLEKTVRYDIENWKKFPGATDQIISEGVDVTFTEKLHGTWTLFGLFRNDDGTYDRIISSKGHSHDGIAFKLDSDANQNNLYVRTANQLDFWTKLEKNSALSILQPGQGVFVMGETFGGGVQSGFGYGADATKGNIGFRIFDIMQRDNNTGVDTYLGYDDLQLEADLLGVSLVPVLYRGPFSYDLLDEHTKGLETVSGQESHMREGVVITPVTEMRYDDLGRLKLKSVSEQYLLRKDKNATEYS